jgi:aspartate 1-decarboxylase
MSTPLAHTDDFRSPAVTQLREDLALALRAAAHQFDPKDMVIIVAYCQIDSKKAAKHKPKVVLVDKKNKPIKK